MRPFGLLTIASLSAIMVMALVVTDVSAAAETTGTDWLDDPAYNSAEFIQVLVLLDQQSLADDVHRAAAAPGMSRERRIKAVSQHLQSFRPLGADGVERFVHERSSVPIVRYWIVPAYRATLTEADIRVLSLMPGVSRVVPDEPVDLIEPVETRVEPTLATTSSSHVQMMNIPYLWARGITGLGRLVCSFDTGVESDHPALSGNWRGNHAPLAASWFSTISPTSLPYDKADHGTHTMGTMVGRAGTDTIGVAPGAEWITAGVIDQGKSLSGTFSDILAAFQWALNPDGNPATTDDVPDVILNSWGVPASLFTPCDATFFAAIDNVEAAGIVCIFSAGNEGPAVSTLRNPASRASSPLNAFAVGAVDNAKVIASFSSRGPGGCGFTQIKPEIVAPGVGIRSAAKDGGYKIMSGTSMAAPFIAGLVALCRQYNPDATVEEIKWAIVNSAEDLGPTGEDNSYGYGLPDASRILDYLSDPETPHFRLAGYSILGDGVASPDETFDLQLTLTRTTGTVESVNGLLVSSQTQGVTIPGDSLSFYFGVSGTTSIGSGFFTVHFDPSLVHGQTVQLALRVTGDGDRLFDSLSFSVPVGYAPHGTVADHDAGRLHFSVSDFGQYGLAAGSIYNVGGVGFSYDGSGNLLYEAGIILGRNDLQLSSSIRGGDAVFTPSDFAPEMPLSELWVGRDGASYRTARLADDYSDISIPVAITQHTADYAAVGDEGIIIIRYRLVNTSLSTLSDLYFGFFSDFDLPGGSESLSYDPTLDLLLQSGDYGPVVGLVGLSRIGVHTVLANGLAKTGFTRSEQYDLIAAAANTDLTTVGDLMSVLSGGPYRLAPGDSVEVVLALVAGATVEEIYDRAVRAREIYLMPTVVDYPQTSLPGGFCLHQNYPNPFNPTTTIAFELPVAGDVRMTVFNLLGQKVRTLHSGWLSAGTHSLDWDGRSDGGEAASGVYFYRLSAEGFNQSRKMVLLR